MAAREGRRRRREPPASVELVGHAGFVRALAVSGGGALLFSTGGQVGARVTRTRAALRAERPGWCCSPSTTASLLGRRGRDDQGGTSRASSASARSPAPTAAPAPSRARRLRRPADPRVGERDHTIRLWELSTLEWRQACGTSHFDSVVAFAAVGNTLYSGSRDRHIKRWSLRDGACLHSAVNAHDDWVCALAASSDSLLSPAAATAGSSWGVAASRTAPSAPSTATRRASTGSSSGRRDRLRVVRPDGAAVDEG